jgi:hypothetical protein
VAVSAAVFLLALLAATGLAGLVYVAVYALAVAPGIVLGRALVNRRHPAGLLIGAAIGYGVVQLALWIPVALGLASKPAFLLAWLLLAATLLLIARRIHSPVLPLSDPTPGDVRALALVLLLVPVVMGPPYRNLGAPDETGTRLYRAYFTADFVWHTALAAELGRYDRPPRNPYFASEPLHYYWTYFLLPAVLARESPPPLDDVQVALKANAMASGLVLIGMLFVFVRLAVPTAGAAAVAVGLGVVAASAEGTFALQQIWRAGAPLAALTDMNIDAVTAWQYQGLRIDGLPRGLWYNPQHSVACALGLVAATIAAARGAQASRGAIWLAGVSLGLSTCFNPFVGAIFCAIYGLAVAVDAIRHPGVVRILASHAQAAVPVLIGLGWVFLNDVASRAGTAVTFGFLGGARNNTVTSLLLSVGPILVPSLAGLWAWRNLPAQPARVATIGAVLSLLVMHLVTLSESSWVGFRTGQILLLMLPALLARAIWVVQQRGIAWAGLLVGGVLIGGLPTTLIDTYNAQDVTNRREGPGFHWTLGVTTAQQAAFAWARKSLPDNATVQMEPMLRGREHWSLIPTFAQRRMIAGLPISLLPMPEYAQASAEVQQLFRAEDPREAWQIARARGIQYLYVDGEDRAAYPAGVAKFSTGSLFEKVYERAGVAFYKVR